MRGLPGASGLQLPAFLLGNNNSNKNNKTNTYKYFVYLSFLDAVLNILQ